MGVLDDYYDTSIELLFCGRVCMEAVIAADYGTMQVRSGIYSFVTMTFLTLGWLG